MSTQLLLRELHKFLNNNELKPAETNKLYLVHYARTNNPYYELVDTTAPITRAVLATIYDHNIAEILAAAALNIYITT